MAVSMSGNDGPRGRTWAEKGEQAARDAARELRDADEPLALLAAGGRNDRNRDDSGPDDDSRARGPPVPPSTLLLVPDPGVRVLVRAAPRGRTLAKAEDDRLARAGVCRLERAVERGEDRAEDEHAHDDEPRVRARETRARKEVPLAPTAVDAEVADEAPAHLDQHRAADANRGGNRPLIPSPFVRGGRVARAPDRRAPRASGGR